MPSSLSSGRARLRAFSSLRSCSTTGTHSASHCGQIAAEPWRVRQSAQSPRPHLPQTASETTVEWLAQKRQLLRPRARGATGRAGARGAAVAGSCGSRAADPCALWPRPAPPIGAVGAAGTARGAGSGEEAVGTAAATAGGGMTGTGGAGRGCVPVSGDCRDRRRRRGGLRCGHRVGSRRRLRDGEDRATASALRAQVGCRGLLGWNADAPLASRAQHGHRRLLWFRGDYRQSGAARPRAISRRLWPGTATGSSASRRCGRRAA